MACIKGNSEVVKPILIYLVLLLVILLVLLQLSYSYSNASLFSTAEYGAPMGAVARGMIFLGPLTVVSLIWYYFWTRRAIKSVTENIRCKETDRVKLERYLNRLDRGSKLVVVGMLFDLVSFTFYYLLLYEGLGPSPGVIAVDYASLAVSIAGVALTIWGLGLVGHAISEIGRRVEYSEAVELGGRAVLIGTVVGLLPYLVYYNVEVFTGELPFVVLASSVSVAGLAVASGGTLVVVLYLISLRTAKPD